MKGNCEHENNDIYLIRAKVNKDEKLKNAERKKLLVREQERKNSIRFIKRQTKVDPEHEFVVFCVTKDNKMHLIEFKCFFVTKGVLALEP